jgi:hypothetical protein
MKALSEGRRLFFETEPFATERALEREGHEHIFNWSKYAETPDSFGLIAGDVIHNLRSSLDHLAMALAESGASAKGGHNDPQEIARIQFPIVTKHTYFVDQCKRGSLLNVEQGAVDLIEAY